MTIRRGEIWIANLDPTEGSEQAGVRPTIIFQNDTITRFLGPQAIELEGKVRSTLLFIK
jgi:mRNA-degrading endonuclease toxin of MazEF toxin-antitoxin module